MNATQSYAPLKEPTEAFDATKAYPRHFAAHPKGGFHMGYVNDTKATEIVKSVLKKIGGKIIKGEIQNIMALSKPPILCKDMSYMEVIATDLMYTDWLKLAASVPNDPLFQMKCVITQTLSSMYISPELMYMKAPMDSLLGETCHLTKSDGTNFYSESINTSPPQALYMIVGPNKSYRLYGSHQVKAQVQPSLNALNGNAFGSKIIDFGDGNKFECEFSQLQISGLLIGDRVMNQTKSFRVTNHKAKLVAEIKFHFESTNQVTKVASSIGSFFGVGKKNASAAEKRKIDDFDVLIQKVQDMDGEILKSDLSSGCGNWMEYIQFDGVVFWKMADKQEYWKAGEGLLPSDCTYRLDRELIKKGMLDFAEKQQAIYEERDNKQKELRAKHKKQMNMK